MKYILLINQGDAPTPGTDAWEKLSEAEQRGVYEDYQALNEHPGMTPGERMDAPDTATTIRVQDGETLTTDGPYVETKEALGGYAILEVDDLDAAIEVVSKIPAARMGGSVEIRPLVEQA